MDDGRLELLRKPQSSLQQLRAGLDRLDQTGEGVPHLLGRVVSLNLSTSNVINNQEKNTLLFVFLTPTKGIRSAMSKSFSMARAKDPESRPSLACAGPSIFPLRKGPTTAILGSIFAHSGDSPKLHFWSLSCFEFAHSSPFNCLEIVLRFLAVYFTWDSD